jgi:hypothetical protein
MLIEALAQRFDVAASVASIQAAQRKRAWRNAAWVFIGVAAGIVWGVLRHH